MRYVTYIILITATIISATHAYAQRDSIAQGYAIDEVNVKGQSTKPVFSGLQEGTVLLNPTTLSSLPAMLGTTDLLKLLELTPSVQNAGDANTDLYIRGGEAGQNLLLYNYVPLYSPGHLAGFFPLFNADHIASLELSKSGIDAQYGGRLSSVVDVQTKSVLPDKIALAGNVGLLASQATLAAPLGKKFGLYLSGRKTYINSIIMPFISTIDPKNSIDNAGYDFYDANITLVGKLSERNRIKADAFFGKDKLSLSEEDIYINGGLDWSNAAFSLQWDTKAVRCDFSQLAYSSNYNNDLDINQVEMDIGLTSNIRDVGYKSSLNFSLGGVALESGVQYAFHNIQPQTFSVANDNQQYNNGGVSGQQAHDAALYLGASAYLMPRLTLDAGLRYNFFYCDKSFSSLDPRMSLRYSLSNDNVTLRASYSRQHQYINLLTPSSIGIPTNFWLASSANVKPQSGNEFSVGYAQRLMDGAFDLSVEAYYRNMDNVTEYFQNFITTQDNSYVSSILYGSGRAYGVELIVKKNAGKLTGWISYALGRSERNFDGINGGKTFPAQFDRRHGLSLVATYTFNKKWDASVVYAFATGNAYTQPSSWYFINSTPVREYANHNSSRMPSYNRTDISVNYWFKKNNGLNFSIYDVFMVRNPIYVFLKVEKDEKTGKLGVQTKPKTLYTIVPSISWRFKF